MDSDPWLIFILDEGNWDRKYIKTFSLIIKSFRCGSTVNNIIFWVVFFYFENQILIVYLDYVYLITDFKIIIK